MLLVFAQSLPPQQRVRGVDSANRCRVHAPTVTAEACLWCRLHGDQPTPAAGSAVVGRVTALGLRPLQGPFL